MYRVISIDKTEPPPNSNSTYWYRYTIDNESGNLITGKRAGTRQEITGFANDWVNELNKKYRSAHKHVAAFARTVNVDTLAPFYR